MPRLIYDSGDFLITANKTETTDEYLYSDKTSENINDEKFRIFISL
jgi:hypothetical protein